MKIRNVTTAEVVAQRVIRCDRFESRMRGLLGRPPLLENEVCWITPCRSIHTLGMGYDLEVCFIDCDGRVVRVFPRLKPWSFSPIVWRAHSVLEFTSRLQPRCRLGDFLKFEASSEK